MLKNSNLKFTIDSEDNITERMNAFIDEVSGLRSNNSITDKNARTAAIRESFKAKVDIEEDHFGFTDIGKNIGS